MRKAKLGAGRIQVTVMYSDGVRVFGERRGKRLYVTDKEIGDGAVQVYGKIVKRRLRIRAINITLDDLRPLGREPDLFLPEDTDRGRRLQEAVDALRNRYGITAIMSGAVLAASGQKPVLPILIHL